ncbi:phosphoglycolate phosphatase/pyrophosphatase PpaX [Nonomuraea solani]|uniref:Phosphoglycolate phosphatase/pyrophosphatase PpaX n=1 Tax=Nonomuraea solani TaxID=1144553 RepID=A0A1H6EQR1_9ACTN|nr:HAD-IA family hydrolase [Nonomuraea solani]SEH00198.1 phosphoglycolate phosphatase/pyrophosphatase PpaX [Nonomuraea solani]
MSLRAHAVLVDLDGVIINSFPTTSAAIAAVASAELGRLISAADCHPYAGGPPPDALRLLGVADPDLAYERGFDAAMRAALAETVIFTDVVAAITELARAGASIAVVTAQARRRVGMLLPPDLADHIGVVIAHEDVDRPKPAPDGVRAALRTLGVPPERAVFVGDAPKDMLAGRAAGVCSLGVTWGFHTEEELVEAGADGIVRDPTDLTARIVHHLGPASGG